MRRVNRKHGGEGSAVRHATSPRGREEARGNRRSNRRGEAHASDSTQADRTPESRGVHRSARARWFSATVGKKSGLGSSGRFHRHVHVATLPGVTEKRPRARPGLSAAITVHRPLALARAYCGRLVATRSAARNSRANSSISFASRSETAQNSRPFAFHRAIL
jgi:hypothetical protein